MTHTEPDIDDDPTPGPVGAVTFVGAAPGDFGLVTFAAARVISQADLLVLDSPDDADALAQAVRRAESGERIKEHLLLTRYNPARAALGEMLTVTDVEDILSIPLLGVIPESQAVLKASNQGVPVIMDEVSDAGQAYGDAVDRLLGETIPHRFLEAEKKSLLQRLFGGR